MFAIVDDECAFCTGRIRIKDLTEHDIAELDDTKKIKICLKHQHQIFDSIVHENYKEEKK